MMKQYDRLFDPAVVTMIETATGAPFPMPLMDDTSAVATQINENIVSVHGPDLVFGQLGLPAALAWRSGYITVPNQLFQDSGIDIESMLIAGFAIRFSRGIGAANVATLLSSIAGYYVTASKSNSITVDDLHSLMGYIDPAYLASPKCYWLMNQKTLISILKLKDSVDAYLIHPRKDENGNLLLLEKPVAICPSMADIGTSGSPLVGNIPVALGDFGRFAVRVVKDSWGLIRAREAPGLAENNCTAFQMSVRANAGMLLQSGSDSPIKVPAERDAIIAQGRAQTQKCGPRGR